MKLTTRPLVTDDIAGCADVLTGLPEWFAQSAPNAAYIDGLSSSSAFVVTDDTDELVGFVGLKSRSEVSAEIEVMAVRRDLHRSGVGRQLVGASIRWARDVRELDRSEGRDRQR